MTVNTPESLLVEAVRTVMSWMPDQFGAEEDQLLWQINNKLGDALAMIDKQQAVKDDRTLRGGN